MLDCSHQKIWGQGLVSLVRFGKRPVSAAVAEIQILNPVTYPLGRSIGEKRHCGSIAICSSSAVCFFFKKKD